MKYYALNQAKLIEVTENDEWVCSVEQFGDLWRIEAAQFYAKHGELRLEVTASLCDLRSALRLFAAVLRQDGLEDKYGHR